MLPVFGMEFRAGMSLLRLGIPKALWRLACKGVTSIFFLGGGGVYSVFIRGIIFLFSLSSF